MNNPNSLGFSLYFRCSSALMISVALCWTHSSMPIILGNPELDTALQMKSHQCCRDKTITSLDLLQHLPSATPETAGPSLQRGHTILELEKVILENQPAVLDPLLSRTVFHGLVVGPWKASLKSVLLRSRYPRRHRERGWPTNSGYRRNWLLSCLDGFLCCSSGDILSY